MRDIGDADRMISGRKNGQSTERSWLKSVTRVSTGDQDLALQMDALKRADCERIFTDKASGAKVDRPGLTQALAYVRDGDALVVWKFDRLGRSLPHLIETVTALQVRSVGLRSLTENIDTTTPGGRLIFNVFGALASFERDLIRERTKAGLAAAAARGRQGGRKPVVTSDKLTRAKGLLANGLTVREAAMRVKVGKPRSIGLSPKRNTPLLARRSPLLPVRSRERGIKCTFVT